MSCSTFTGQQFHPLTRSDIACQSNAPGSGLPQKHIANTHMFKYTTYVSTLLTHMFKYTTYISILLSLTVFKYTTYGFW